MRRMTILIGVTLAALWWASSLEPFSLHGQAPTPLGVNVNNFAGISSGRYALSLALSKDGDSAGALTIPPGRDFVVAFSTDQRHSHAPDGSRFEFHGDFVVYPQPPSYTSEGRFHPDRTLFQWASEGPVAIVGHDMDLVISRVQ
jgi:hypothetical protein